MAARWCHDFALVTSPHVESLLLKTMGLTHLKLQMNKSYNDHTLWGGEQVKKWILKLFSGKKCRNII